MFYFYHPNLILFGKTNSFVHIDEIVHFLFNCSILNTFLNIFRNLFKKKAIKTHFMYYKSKYCNTYFNFMFTTSNVFINFMKNGKVLLHRSLGMLGFRKKKKKINNNAIYSLGKDFVEKLKKLYYSNNFRRATLRIKGFHRFLRSSTSNLLHHLRFASKFFSNKMKGQRKWFASKFRIAKKCHKRKVRYIQTSNQRRRESTIRRDVAKAQRLLLRLTLVNYLTSISFADHKYGHINLYTRYVKKRFY